MDHSVIQDQEIQSHSLENILGSSNGQHERKPRPQPEQALKCPRCESMNTKFCYYNNYSLSQPRYFCKSCRRYWTKGGTLRNVPVGGGCRKNRRSSSSSSSSFSSKFRPQDQQLSLTGFPSLSYDSNDLDLAFTRLQKNFSGQSFDEHDFTFLGNSSATHCDPVAGNHGFSDISSTGCHGVTSFQNLYHWFDNGNSYSGYQQVENGGRSFVGSREETGWPSERLMNNSSAPTVTEKTTKQELVNGENKLLWGFPWQTTEEGNIEEFHLRRESWNSNAIASSWQQGLLHTPLM